jgi:hypothetical protein
MFINTTTYSASTIKTKKVKVTTDTTEYCYDILNYISAPVHEAKDFYEEDFMSEDTMIGCYRSVVVDPETNYILCFSPPKSINNEAFKMLHLLEHNKINQNLMKNAIIEGTMINLFYDPRRETWEIATKGAIGGKYWYYRTQYDGTDNCQLTFRDMFCDALKVSRDCEFSNIGLFDKLNKDHCYNLVLQHPNNHIVLQIHEPMLYIVSAFKLEKSMVSYVNIHEEYIIQSFNGSVVRFPNEYTVDETIYSNFAEDDNYYNVYPGYMVTDIHTGLRSSFKNPNYEYIKSIRGNNPNMQFHFFALQQADKLKEFLQYFPKYKDMFYKFHIQCGKFIQSIHDAYVSYYVQKKGKDVRIPKNIFPHIYKLHFDVHLPSIEIGNKVIVTKQIVADYWNKMEPKEKLYYISKTPEV